MMSERDRSMQTKVVRKSASSAHFDIWQNFARHEKELRALGACDREIERLRTAAEAVDNTDNTASPGAFDQPHICSNGWVIEPPTFAARKWASTIMLACLGGQDPQSGLAVLYSMAITLWALHAWGQGRKRDVMMASLIPDRQAEVLTQIIPECEHVDIEALARDVRILMGGGDAADADADADEKKTLQQAIQEYYGVRQQIVTTLISLSAGSGPLSEKTSV